MNSIRISIIVAAIVATLHAQESEIVLEPLEIQASILKSDELHATRSVEVYTQEDIEKAHVRTVYEFLLNETSVIALPSYGNVFTQKIDFRGFGYENGYQNIVVKINGRRLNNIDMVPQLLSSISPSQIERIEIVKGSGIVEAGDGANAGVIDIITKTSDQTSIGFFGGSYYTFGGDFYSGYADETFMFSLSAQAQKSDGIRRIGNDERDSSKFTNVAFEAVYMPRRDIELRLGALINDIDTWYAGSLTKKEYEEDVFQKGQSNYGATRQFYASDALTSGIRYDLDEVFSIEIDGSYEYKTSRYPAYDFLARYHYSGYGGRLVYDNDALQAVVGVDGFLGKRVQSGDATQKENVGVYTKIEYEFYRNRIDAGYRHERIAYTYSPNDADDLEDSHTLDGFELGYNYTFDTDTSVFIHYSHSYQAPDIDRFFATTYPPPNYTPVVSFNGFIKPMQANNYTIGYNYVTRTNKLKIAAYYIDLRNEIYYYSVGSFDPANKNTNIDASSKYGVDVYEKYLFSQEYAVSINYSYVLAKIDEEVQNGEDFGGNELPGVSNHNVKLTLEYRPDSRMLLSVRQIYRSKAYAANDFSNSFSQKQDPFYSTDVALTYSTKKWEVYGKIDNIFNQKNGIWIRDDVIYPTRYTTMAYAGFRLKY